MVVWNVLLRTSVSNLWPVQLLAVFDAWTYLPVIPLLLLAILQKDWRGGAWLVLPMLAFAWQYGQLFVPVAHRQDGPQLRVMTANLQFENRDANGVATLLSARSPDVVAMQELGAAISGPLANMVKQQYPYQALYPSRGSRGMGILSRYPIVDSRPPEMGDAECSCQQVTLDVRGQPVTILNVHPNPPGISARRIGPLVLPTGFRIGQQQQTLLAIRHLASTITTPLLIVGDLNTSDHEMTYPILAKPYHDTFREAGWGLGFTFPSGPGDVEWPFPAMRIDYVFHDDSWAAKVAQVETVPGSDHDGILAELVLKPALAQRGPAE